MPRCLLATIARPGAVAKLAKAPVSKTGDSRFESWLPRSGAPARGRWSRFPLDPRALGVMGRQGLCARRIPHPAPRPGDPDAAPRARRCLPGRADAAQCKGGDAAPAKLSNKRMTKAVFCLLNKERRSHGLHRLHRQHAQTKAAREHNRRMVRKRCFSHRVPGRARPDRPADRDRLPALQLQLGDRREHRLRQRPLRIPAQHRRRLDAQPRAPDEHPQRQLPAHRRRRLAAARRPPAANATPPPTPPTSGTSASCQYGGRDAPRPDKQPEQPPRDPDDRDLRDRARDGAARHGRAAPSRDREPDRRRRRGPRPGARRLRDPDPLHLASGRPPRRPDRPPAAPARRPRPDRARLDPDRHVGRARTAARRPRRPGRRLDAELGRRPGARLRPRPAGAQGRGDRLRPRRQQPRRDRRPGARRHRRRHHLVRGALHPRQLHRGGHVRRRLRRPAPRAGRADGRADRAPRHLRLAAPARRRSAGRSSPRSAPPSSDSSTSSSPSTSIVGSAPAPRRSA